MERNYTKCQRNKTSKHIKRQPNCNWQQTVNNLNSFSNQSAMTEVDNCSDLQKTVQKLSMNVYYL